MRNLLAKSIRPPTLFHAQLQTIWYVEADKTYRNQKKKGFSRYQYVALRTLTGHGSLALQNGQAYSLLPNSLIVVQTDDIAYYATEAENWQFYWIEFDLSGPSPALLNQAVEIPLNAQERIELERCVLALSSGTPEEYQLAEALFGYRLADWQLCWLRASKNGLERQKIIALLEKGRREHMNIPEMAREAGLCERGFRNAVQTATGLSPKAYMLKGEMAAAMELLRTSNMPIGEIAACFHYASPFYFSRVFKKYYGISPQHVRDGISL